MTTLKEAITEKPRDFFLSWIHSYSNGRLSQVTHLIVENPGPDVLENNGVHVVEMKAVMPLLEALKFYQYHADCKTDDMFVCHCQFCRNESKYRRVLAPWADVMKGMK